MPVFIDGHHLITPTSVAKTGTGSTATINTNGSVTFSSCATLSLNGVFSADYDNYIIVLLTKATTAGTAPYMTLRASGTNSSTGYTNQYILADSTSVTGSRATGANYFDPIYLRSTTLYQGLVTYFYGPYLAQPTAIRSISASALSSADIFDEASTHSVSTAYDGFTYTMSSSTFTGLVCVYGAVK